MAITDLAPRSKCLLAALVTALSAAPASAAETPWTDGFKHRARVTTGKVSDGANAGTYAFFELEMPAGWKTYWRNPGDAGGIPPAFDWSKSQNVKQADVLYPAPHRLSDRAGDTIGYKEHVIFPIRLTPSDSASPVTFNLVAQFGICEKICVPAEASFEILVPATAEEPSSEAVAALQAVPALAVQLRPGDPKLVKLSQQLNGTSPKLLFDVRVPGGVEGADLFLEAPDGLYVPLPAKTGGGGDDVRFEADLSKDVDLAALKGKTIRATLVGSKGQSETTFKID